MRLALLLGVCPLVVLSSAHAPMPSCAALAHGSTGTTSATSDAHATDARRADGARAASLVEHLRRLLRVAVRRAGEPLGSAAQAWDGDPCAAAQPAPIFVETVLGARSRRPRPSLDERPLRAADPAVVACLQPIALPLGPGGRYFLSFTADVVVPGVGTVADEDIVSYDAATSTWELYFDGSDVGLAGTDVDALHVLADGDLVLSFDSATYSVPGLVGGPSGTTVEDSDLVSFTFTTSGASTTGSFSFLFDGSDVGLTTTNENIDGIYEFPTGGLGISCLGGVSVPGVTAEDEDVLRFAATQYGSVTSGSWSLYFDGSDVGFSTSSSEDLDAIAFDDGNDLLLSTVGAFSGSGAAGQDEDVARFAGTFGSATSGSATLELVLAGLGIASSANVDGLHYEPPAPLSLGSHYVVAGGTLVPGGFVADVEVQDGVIVAIGAVSGGLPVLDVSGKWVAPAFIDSHVHLDYRPRIAGMARGGIAAGVDWACRTSFFGMPKNPLQLLLSGPMLVENGGYSIGPGFSYGVVDAPASAAAGVDYLAGLGANVIKLPVTGAPQLSQASLDAAVARAHALGLKVGSHAIDNAYWDQAFAAGVDLLVHTPRGAMSEASLEQWKTRAVVSTLVAFGGTSTTVNNLAQLFVRGATVLYGTDFGNPTAVYEGVDPVEINLLLQAGLTPADILAAGTSVPAAYFGFADLGAIEVGKAASLMILDANPLVSPLTLATPDRVLIAGALQ